MVHAAGGRSAYQTVVPDAGARTAGRPRGWDRVGTAKAAADFRRRFAGVRLLDPDLAPWTPVAAAESARRPLTTRTTSARSRSRRPA